MFQKRGKTPVVTSLAAIIAVPQEFVISGEKKRFG